MDQFIARIETLEHQLMRAWMVRDRKAMRGLLSRDFIFHLAGGKGAILDRPSWLDAASGRFKLEAYRFGDVYARQLGRTAVFVAPIALEMKMGPLEWTGEFRLTDVWQKGRVRRSWNLVERVLARPESDEDMPAAIRDLQLWR
ncbi:nuclear transport factor 2 family protein [Pseudoblastomonas halimionae]|uniref:DUF4440 domain-containing protein n=1 Tax=Alteriqipengyuania halimionae TaxID=1926630 RepID=A0A6I4U2A1_9SPHN|nr:nuclear transport factor 2 family protein [Alteriqipengyuania halimionae]MXP09424.1 DUF4440 domain-containing protein [Alteriqipengyuania halimionae]